MSDSDFFSCQAQYYNERRYLLGPCSVAGDGGVFGVQELRERDPNETHTLKHTSLDQLVNRIQLHGSFYWHDSSRTRLHIQINN